MRLLFFLEWLACNERCILLSWCLFPTHSTRNPHLGFTGFPTTRFCHAPQPAKQIDSQSVEKYLNIIINLLVVLVLTPVSLKQCVVRGRGGSCQNEYLIRHTKLNLTRTNSVTFIGLPKKATIGVRHPRTL